MQIRAAKAAIAQTPDDGTHGCRRALAPLAWNRIAVGTARSNFLVACKGEQLRVTAWPPAPQAFCARSLGPSNRVAAAKTKRRAACETLRQRQDRDPPAIRINAP